MRSSQFDLSVFKDDHYNDCDKSNYTKCIAMNRLINGLKYYSVLNIMKNENDREIFRHFVIEIYCAFNDDYIHFEEYHHDELEQIYKDLINNKQFNECNIKECQYTARHHRMTQKTNESNDVLDPMINFYKNMMDGLHFHLFHCFVAGLRTIDAYDDVEDENEDEQCDDYFDAAFARIHRNIIKREQNTKAFERFSIKNTKFNILTQNKDTMNNNDNDNVYCDAIFKYLFKAKLSNDEIKELYHLIETEEYDTDSIKHDEELEHNGNIILNIKNKTFQKIYIQFIKNTKMTAQSFAIGFRFYYWIYYKYIKQLDDKSIMNINDHSGFEVKELFVEAKYVSLKEEIRNNKHISLKQYKEEVVIKVTEYQQSVRFKKMTATGYGTLYLHYDIKKGDSIRFEHLLSLVLYTDYTNLCTEFSGTFRRKNIFESLKNVIKRNMEYYWMSKYLRECVEVFGQCYYDTERWNNDYLRGPFYAGMSVAMNVSSFNMRLCSPTSTSRQIEVAMKFSGSQGMILQLNNTDDYQYNKLHGFNASLISKYKEEDERLFFGGFWFIKIESVRLRSTKQNFEKFMFSLYYLDTMLTGGRIYTLKITKADVFITNNFMNAVLNKNKETTKRFDDYLYETFAAFTSNKKQIVLDLDNLNDANDSGIRDLLMNSLEKREQMEEKTREDKDMTNLFKPQIFKIFKNIQNIIIKTTENGGDSSFSLSMMALLTVIESSSLQQIIVKAECDGEDNNWIKEIWTLSSKHLTKSYQDQNYIISIKEKEDDEYWFMINKKT